MIMIKKIIQSYKIATPASGGFATTRQKRHCEEHIPTCHCQEHIPTCHCEEHIPTCHCQEHIPTCHCEEHIPTCHCEERSDEAISDRA